MTGSWQAEAVLATACLAAAGWLAARSRVPGARWAAAALALLAVAAVLGGLLFAGVAPSIAPTHDAVSRLFATLGFAIVATILVGGSRRLGWATGVAAGLLALIGLAVPLAPVVLVAHGVAAWRGPHRARHLVAFAAMAAVIAGQVAIAAGPARLDTLHVTLAVWALALAAALG